MLFLLIPFDISVGENRSESTRDAREPDNQTIGEIASTLSIAAGRDHSRAARRASQTESLIEGAALL